MAKKTKVRALPEVPKDYEAPLQPPINYPTPLSDELIIDRLSSEYLKDYDLRKAAKRMGISCGTAYRLYEYNREFKKLLREKCGKLVKHVDVTVQRILEELVAIAYSNAADYMEVAPDGKSFELSLEGLCREQMAAIQEFSIAPGREGNIFKIKIASKKDALELLGRHKKMWGNVADDTNEDGTAVKAPSLIVQFVDGPGK